MQNREDCSVLKKGLELKFGSKAGHVFIVQQNWFRELAHELQVVVNMS